jgi:hypothetical protein
MLLVILFNLIIMHAQVMYQLHASKRGERINLDDIFSYFDSVRKLIFYYKI